MNGHHIEPIKQILAKQPLFDVVFQGLVGGGEHAHIHRDIALAAEPGKLTILKHVQQLGL